MARDRRARFVRITPLDGAVRRTRNVHAHTNTSGSVKAKQTTGRGSRNRKWRGEGYSMMSYQNLYLLDDLCKENVFL